MVVRGTYKKGTVVLDEDLALADGQRVEVNVEASTEPSVQAKPSTTTQKLLRISGAIKDGPVDASRNLDHYLYGSPKRKS